MYFSCAHKDKACRPKAPELAVQSLPPKSNTQLLKVHHKRAYAVLLQHGLVILQFLLLSQRRSNEGTLIQRSNRGLVWLMIKLQECEQAQCNTYASNVLLVLILANYMYMWGSEMIMYMIMYYIFPVLHLQILLHYNYNYGGSALVKDHDKRTFWIDVNSSIVIAHILH